MIMRMQPSLWTSHYYVFADSHDNENAAVSMDVTDYYVFADSHDNENAAVSMDVTLQRVC